MGKIFNFNLKRESISTVKVIYIFSSVLYLQTPEILRKGFVHARLRPTDQIKPRELASRSS